MDNAFSTFDFTLEIADTSAQLEEVFRLRYQVYCIDHPFETGQNGRETDVYDLHSRHVLLRNIEGVVFGTIRLILPNPTDLEHSFPIQTVVDHSLLEGIPLAYSGETSRMAMLRHRPVNASPVTLRMALWQGTIQIAHEEGLTHLFGVMETSTIRLHARSGLYFETVGPMVEYHGWRQPMVGHIASTMDRLKQEQPSIWAYISNGRCF